MLWPPYNNKLNNKIFYSVRYDFLNNSAAKHFWFNNHFRYAKQTIVLKGILF